MQHITSKGLSIYFLGKGGRVGLCFYHPGQKFAHETQIRLFLT